MLAFASVLPLAHGGFSSGVLPLAISQMIYTPQAPGKRPTPRKNRPRPPQREGPRRHEWRHEQPSLGQERVEPRREVAGVHAGERLHGAGAVDHKVGAEVPLDLARGLGLQK